MSSSSNSSNTTGQVSHNIYFDGKVQSLGLETDRGPATVGVMKEGTYVFGTSSPETIVVISGNLSTRVGGGDWLKHNKNDEFKIGPNLKFEAMCETDVAYICYYG